MSKRFRMSTALDVDDLLMECIPYAIRLANEKYKFDPPITIYEVDRWGKLDSRADVIFEFFDDPDFYRNQPVIQGAREFVRKLTKMTDVFISTSIPPKYMGIRAERIMEEFPEIPPEHIYMGSRKDKLDVDILFDDGMHNVFKSNASYPILMRRPWNQSATGMLAVNNYDEFLKMLEVITNSYTYVEGTEQAPQIVVLVGPSGSGKRKIAKSLLEKSDRFGMLVSYTTKESAAENESDLYTHISRKQFFQMLEHGEFCESTRYSGQGFGSRKEDVDKILASGRIVLATMDICGAMALKTNYSNVATVYIKQRRRELLSSILRKDCSDEDKVNRIIAIDDEKRNRQICDHVVYHEGCDKTAEKILAQLHLE